MDTRVAGKSKKSFTVTSDLMGIQRMDSNHNYFTPLGPGQQIAIDVATNKLLEVHNRQRQLVRSPVINDGKRPFKHSLDEFLMRKFSYDLLEEAQKAVPLKGRRGRCLFHLVGMWVDRWVGMEVGIRSRVSLACLSPPPHCDHNALSHQVTPSLLLPKHPQFG